MINFATLQGMTIPEGVVTQIEKDGVVLWQMETSKPIILEVEKIASDTYAGETTYTAEEFILLDIYPKTNGTVNVTYGGLTKTITDTSGAEEPNAHQVFFGTFNGVSDSVVTPTSGEVTIEGDYASVTKASYQKMGEKSAGTYQCACIKNIKSLGSISRIYEYAFSNIVGLTNLKIPNSVLTFGNGAFSNCTNLTSVDIQCSDISAYAFSNCTNLTSVTIGKDVTNIEYCAFSGCEKLVEFLIKGDSFVSENGALFTSDKTKLLSYPTATGAYSIPNGVIDITGVFAKCKNLTSVTIPSSVKSIGSSTFDECTNLTSVTIPSSVKSIGSNAFYRCNLTSLFIPEGVTSIGSSAFNGSIKAIDKLAIPSTVEYIGSSAFLKFGYDDGASSLEVTLLPTTPPTLESADVFGDINFIDDEDTLSIIVPKGTAALYKDTTKWISLRQYIVEAN